MSKATWSNNKASVAIDTTSSASRNTSQQNLTSNAASIANGASLVKNTGTALEGIQSSVTGIVDRLRSIAAATSDQSRGLTEVNEAVSDLERVTQQNAGMFEETTAANAMLAGSADELNALMKSFSLSDRPQTTAEPVPVMPPLRAAS